MITYTMNQIQDAYVAITGHEWSTAVQFGMSPPRAVIDAAYRAWVNRYPEDEHTARLRAAIHDLESTGFFKPVDNVWFD